VNAEPEPTPIRRHVIYHGRVQGVFFRATAAELARRYQIVGYVRNLPDGTVELEAEGSPAEVDRYLAAVASEYDTYITRLETNDVPPRGEESDFRITY
jgi:acylphosphatase